MGSTGQTSIPMRFPFYAPAESLPAPLPTVAEIVALEDLFPCIFEKRYICRVGEHFIAKYGQVKLDEAENMLFVAENCGDEVIVPKLYAAFHDEPTGHSFIIMEYIPGKTLESLWEDLSKDEEGARARATIAQHLKTAFDALRQIPSQDGDRGAKYYGKLGFQPYDDIFLGAAGPFPTEQALNEALYQRYAALHGPALARGRGAFYRDCVFPAVLRGHAPVWTHGDLQAKNVLVRQSDGRPYLLDWECAAWYPSYWEYANALWTSRRWGDDWFRFVGGVLGQAHVVEFKCVENLLGDLLDKPQPGVG